MDTFEFRLSDKQGLGVGLVVIRDNISYFRILSNWDESNVDIMTATASEDRDRIIVCPDRPMLVQSTIEFAKELGVTPYPKSDRFGRDYIQFAPLNTKKFKNVEELTIALRSFFEKFFDIFDSNIAAENFSEANDELIDIYNAIAPDSSGGDVYLSDGVWLSSDGSFHDRGR